MQRLVIMVLEGNRSCKFLIAQLAHSQSLCCDPLPFADIFKTEHIVADFGSALRQNAVMHRFIYTTGVADYILTVLVPELAVMLIKEDMKMCDKMARQTLRESVRLGETLHDDVCSLAQGSHLWPCNHSR